MVSTFSASAPPFVERQIVIKRLLSGREMWLEWVSEGLTPPMGSGCLYHLNSGSLCLSSSTAAEWALPTLPPWGFWFSKLPLVTTLFKCGSFLRGAKSFKQIVKFHFPRSHSALLHLSVSSFLTCLYTDSFPKSSLNCLTATSQGSTHYVPH